ncbi:unnamed protein product [Schistosoma curassoni]|uniref:Uncharacterized protein n=1 Tax=Schistosoma curassoni TaxID=6186 RepID=A0A3P8CP49_9TREM|nr:unnamed protein product [Schistosoma curassoni]
MENDYRTYERVNKTRDSLVSGNVNELVAVIHDAPSDPEMSISETCPVMGSNPIVPETLFTNTGLSSSQKDDVLLNAHEIIAVPAHKKTENESSIVMRTVALNGAHHSTTTVSNECTDWGSLVVLPDMNTGYSGDRLSTNEIVKRFDDNVPEKSNFDDPISSVADPHHLVSSSGVSTQCGEYSLNRVKAIDTYENSERNILTLDRQIKSRKGFCIPCTPLVWNQGVQTLLSGSSVSTNPSKALNILISNCEVDYENKHKFGKTLFCGKFHPCNSCVFRNSKCFKCGEIRQVQLVSDTTAHFAATNTNIRNCDSIKLGVSDYHLSLSTTSESGIESNSRPESNETQNHCENKVFNQSASYQISNVTVLDMVCPKDSYISDEITYKSEEDMLSESSPDRKPDALLIDADFYIDPLVFSDIPDTFWKNISEKSNSDLLSNIS